MRSCQNIERSALPTPWPVLPIALCSSATYSVLQTIAVSDAEKQRQNLTGCPAKPAAAAEAAAAARPPVDLEQQEADKKAARAAIEKTGVSARDKMRELIAEALAVALPEVVRQHQAKNLCP